MLRTAESVCAFISAVKLKDAGGEITVGAITLPFAVMGCPQPPLVYKFVVLVVPLGNSYSVCSVPFI